MTGMSADPCARLRDLCRAHGVAALYAFGSRAAEADSFASGRSGSLASGGSDLDIAALPVPDGRIGSAGAVGLAADLEDLFSVSRVDLVLLDRASAFLAVEAVSGRTLVDLTPDFTAEFELFVMRRAGDLLPYELERRRMVIAEGGR